MKKLGLWLGSGFLVLVGIAAASSSTPAAPAGTVMPAATVSAATPSASAEPAVVEAAPTPTPTPVLVATPVPAVATPAASLSNNNYYTNVDGASVHSPAYSNSVPAGATAQCADGSYSFS